LKNRPARGDLVAAVHRLEDFPRSRLPVVALVGRSNVGKSSLINRLLGRPAARVSTTPGRTRGIYFYETEEGHHLADLPGTGFARVGQDERRGWADLAEALVASGRVKLVLALVDPRVADSAVDRGTREWLADRELPAVTVMTKWDRLSAVERTRARAALSGQGELLPVSAKTGEGIEDLRRRIRRCIQEK
jgi:GTP-binding protein